MASPGSGPAHFALFGYDPLKYNVGRGLLSRLQVLIFPCPRNDLYMRANFPLDKFSHIMTQKSRTSGYGKEQTFMHQT